MRLKCADDMKTVSCLGIVVVGMGALTAWLEPPGDPAVALDSSANVRCELALVTNASSPCASGLKITMRNLKSEEPFLFELTSEIRKTFRVHVYQRRLKDGRGCESGTGGDPVVVELAEISRPYEWPQHGMRVEATTVTIPPGASRAWSMEFSEIIDPERVTTNVLRDCSVFVVTILRRQPSVRSVCTWMTNVCISLP